MCVCVCVRERESESEWVSESWGFRASLAHPPRIAGEVRERHNQIQDTEMLAAQSW